MQPTGDPFNLRRFVDAQQHVIESVSTELRSGRKRGHWMWFVFPQLRDLGRTATSQVYGLSSLEEAVAYLQHPVLGQRLIECTKLVVAVEGRFATEIFGDVDAMKFRSCMTLFAKADRGNSIFAEALKKYYEGEFDDLTLSLLDQHD